MAFDVVLRHERVLPHPVDAAFAWLTDYEAGDAARAGGLLVDREIVHEDEEAGRTEMAERRRMLAFARDVHTIVEREPPDAWRARVHEIHDEPPDVFTYRLETVEEQRTRLVATYRYRGLGLPEALLLRAVSPLIRRRIARMWDGFAEAMDRELATA